MKDSIEFKKIFLTLQEVLSNLSSGVIRNVNDINLYANSDGTYFTAALDDKEYAFHFRGDATDFNDIEIGEREAILILDAFEDFYEVLYKEQNTEEMRYEKVVDKLFQKFLKRRKISPHKELLAKSKLQSKKYI